MLTLLFHSSCHLSALLDLQGFSSFPQPPPSLEQLNHTTYYFFMVQPLITAGADTLQPPLTTADGHQPLT